MRAALACNLAFNVTLLYQFVGVSSVNAKQAKVAKGTADAKPKKAKKAD